MVLDPVNHSGTEEDKVAVPYYPPHPITDQVALTVFPARGRSNCSARSRGSRQQRWSAPARKATCARSPPHWPRPGRPFAGAEGCRRARPGDLGRRAAGQLARGRGRGRAEAVPPRPGRQRQLRHQRILSYASNGDLAVSMLRWLADDRATPKLKPATYSTAEVRLTHREMQLTFFLIEILLPLSVMVFGIAVWRRRR